MNTVVGAQLTVWIAGVTVTDTPVLVAAALSTSAAIIAVTTHVPVAVAVNAAPLTEHESDGVTANVLAPDPELPDDDNKIEDKAVIVIADGTTVML